jgi:manganese/zinc/iron transport system ATP- binding protein
MSGSPCSASTPGALLVCDKLSVHFEDRSALSDIELEVRAGETLSLVGPNGAGKSTLLRVLAGLLPATHGEVRLNGRLIEGPSREITYVPQRTSVDWTFPVSVLDVVLMALAGRRARSTPFRAADHDAALGALERTGMRRFANVQIGALSGGQQQRVFLARALLQDGQVYLLDEPFAGVDIPTQELLVSLFEGLSDAGRTIVYATHDLAQATRASDRVLLLNRTLIAAGPPRQVMNAENLRSTFGGAAILPFEQTATVVGNQP